MEEDERVVRLLKELQKEIREVKKMKRKYEAYLREVKALKEGLVGERSEHLTALESRVEAIEGQKNPKDQPEPDLPGYA